MLGVNGQAKDENITIDQGLKENSVSEHHSIKFILNFNA